MAIISVGTNSYVTVAEADTYMALHARGFDLWQILDNPTKERALGTAYRSLERQRWKGAKTVDTQTQEWPRTGVTDKYGNAVATGTVPQEIKNAQIELAVEISQDDAAETNTNASRTTSRVKAEGVEVEWFSPQEAGRYTTAVQELIGQFLAAGGANLVQSFGTGYASSFCENDWEKSGGLA